MARLAIVCGAGIVSGREIMSLELAAGLREEGLDVELVTSRWGSAEFVDRARGIGVGTTALWLGFISASMTIAAARMTGHQITLWLPLLYTYRRFLRKARPEKIVHTNWHHLLLLWPLLRESRDIYWVHEVMPRTPRYLAFFRRLSRRLGCFIAVSNAVATALVDVGVPKAKIRVIHNGLADPAADHTLGQPDRALAIGIIGQVGAWKGHEDLIGAFGSVAAEFPTAELHIFGAGAADYESHLRELATSLTIEQQVVWHGFVADRLEIYRSLSICVVPSRSNDPLPTVAIEAAFFGIPVIASNTGGLPDIVEEGVTGLLFERGDRSDLAMQLRRLLGDGTLRGAMGAQARTRATSLFSRGRFVRDFLAVLALGRAGHQC